MKVYTIKRSQFIPMDMQEAWAFFSSPKNLVKITPPSLKFSIASISRDEKMYPGQIICYRLMVLGVIPFTWVSEITHVEEPYYFVDEQRSGPYAFWHHQHHFNVCEGGIDVTDEVNYAIPFGLLGRLAHVLFVRRQLNAIFDYRFKMLESFFRQEKTYHKQQFAE